MNTLTKQPSGSANISLAAGQFTLQAGTYSLIASAPARRVDNHKARLYNVTDAAVVADGTSTRARGGNDSTDGYSHIYTFFTIASAKVYRIEHRFATTRAADGFGGATGFDQEVYTIVQIFKLS
ncbi:MAG: hypothetical protein E4G90_01550 [Gemmatimonadales bacterium]|nr:MAG: hypothetical protein E4G90_01550 [Gemmatimonadales bacterium]